MRKSYLLPLLAAIGSLACGCARTTVATEVKADGTWNRTLTFRGSGGSREGDKSVSMGPKLTDLFFLPSGAPWKVENVQVGDDPAYRASRTLRLGEALRQDVVVRGKIKGNPGRLVVNEVTVREIAPGRLEYREVLRWQGERAPERTAPDPEGAARVRAALPEALATDENARAVSRLVQREFAFMLFGPGEPILAQMLMHPDLAERRVTRSLGRAIDRALAERFGSRITPAERQATARTLITDAVASSQVGSKARSQAESGPSGSDSKAIVAMLFSVKLPGKIVSTNGEYDAINGDVFWALYSEAASVDDIVLTAVCDVSGGTATPRPAARSRPPGRL